MRQCFAEQDVKERYEIALREINRELDLRKIQTKEI